MRRLLLIALLTMLAAAPGARAQSGAEPVDCTGPTADARPGTADWHRREAENAYCATQRNLDTHSNPLYLAALGDRPLPARSTTAGDPLREPTRLDGHRFRFDELTITGAGGKAYPAMLFRPCDATCTDLPAGLTRHAAPYPGVVVMHGGAANQEMYWWAAEGLAEAGYMVLTLNIGRTDDGHYQAVQDGLDWLLSARNPHRAELDGRRIGLAGHSAGGVAASRLGQEDERVGAIVSWDRAQSGAMPDDLPLRTPAIFFTADYNCQQVPVCLPQPRDAAPDPLGPGTKDEDFRRLRAARVDTMKVALRAAVHLDWTEWPTLNASRLGSVTALYFTLAWFDRYLKGDRSATRRLTAARFDDSADRHSISTGRFDPATGRNVPPTIAGQRAVDRLSFNFRSGYWLEHGAVACEAIRAGCRKRRTRDR
jgi:dienelactone hydrolase